MMGEPDAPARPTSDDDAAPADARAGGGLARALFEQSPFSSVIYDADGHLVAVNDAFRAMWGVGIETAPPGYTVLADPELERQGVLPIIRRAFAGESVATPPVRYDISRVSATGEGRTLWTQGHFYPLRDAAGRVTNVVLTHVDLTERMEAEEAARHSTARIARLQAVTAGLARALDASDVADTVLREGAPALGAAHAVVCVVTPDGRELEILRTLGLPERTTRDFRRFAIDAPLPLSDAARTGEPVFLEDKADVVRRYPALREANARAETQAWIAIPLVADARPVGGLAFGFLEARTFPPEDRTFAIALAQQCAQALERARLYDAERAARAEAEEARRRAEDARARADEANRAKSEFLATMSHELRTPLNAIAGYAELLEMEIRGPVTDAQREDLRRIRRSQRHLLSLIDDVLSFARLEANRVEFDMAPVPVDEVLTSLEDLVTLQLRAKGLAYEYRRAGPSVRALADRDRLEQIVLNLLSNAVKFTDHGTVTMACAARERTVEIAITDTGRGIPADRLDDIFEPFVQVERGLTRTSAGSGLGLTIARDLARRMGGELTAASTVGVGSTFTLVLPRAE